MTETVDSILQSLREHPDALRRYDFNQNGVVDENEWGVVRRMVSTELEYRQDRDPIRLFDTPKVFGDYVVFGLLGHGGQAVTYLAHGPDEQIVALKVRHFRDVSGWKDLDLFEREANVLRRLDHPNIPTYVDAFTDESDDGISFCIAQQFIFGQDLEQLLKRDGPWSEDLAKQFLTTFAPTLRFLHEREPPIVHRDIKPSNIIVDQRGLFHLVDFGAVQHFASTVGGSTVVGTPGFVPLEQYMGRATPASDYFGLAATIAYMLTDVHPSDFEFEYGRTSLPPLNASASFVQVLEEMFEPVAEERLDDADEILRRIETGALVVTMPKALRTYEALELTKPAWLTIQGTEKGVRYRTRQGNSSLGDTLTTSPSEFTLDLVRPKRVIQYAALNLAIMLALTVMIVIVKGNALAVWSLFGLMLACMAGLVVTFELTGRNGLRCNQNELVILKNGRVETKLVTKCVERFVLDRDGNIFVEYAFDEPQRYLVSAGENTPQWRFLVENMNRQLAALRQNEEIDITANQTLGNLFKWLEE